MKPLSRWFELFISVAVLLVVMVLVMWAQSPGADCVMPLEAGRQLQLTRNVDREHLARDLAAAGRVARRYADASPQEAGSLTLFGNCEELLFQAIADRHGLSADIVRKYSN